MKQPAIRLLALRHAHISQLIASGLNVMTGSRHIGHSNPTVTVNVHSHLFGSTDEHASDAVENAKAGLLAE